MAEYNEVIPIIIGFLLLINFPLILFLLSDNYRNTHKNLKSAYKSFFSTINYSYAYGNREYISEFGMNEIHIAKILLSFLKLKKIDNLRSSKILAEVFNTYSEKLLVKISNYKLNELVINYTDKEIDIDHPCKQISKFPTKQRLFLLYNLLDIAAFDQVYSNEEEEFIDSVRKKIKIPVQTFRVIKASYTKRGMKDERIIIEEQNRKKLAESFLPYNAYKILGVSPTVTKSQLKKVYRTLAKKFHPDKYYGQSEEIIQKTEDKFQDITKAYEIIMKHKGF